MCDCAHDEIVALGIGRRHLQIMPALDLLWIRQGIGDRNLVSKPPQPPNEIEAAAVAQVGDVLLEREAEDQRGSCVAPSIMKRIGDPRAHSVVGPASGENDLRIVTKLLSQMTEVIRVDTDAVAAHQPWFEGEEVPFGLPGGEHVPY